MAFLPLDHISARLAIRPSWHTSRHGRHLQLVMHRHRRCYAHGMGLPLTAIHSQRLKPVLARYAIGQPNDGGYRAGGPKGLAQGDGSVLATRVKLED